MDNDERDAARTARSPDEAPEPASRRAAGRSPRPEPGAAVG